MIDNWVKWKQDLLTALDDLRTEEQALLAEKEAKAAAERRRDLREIARLDSLLFTGNGSAKAASDREAALLELRDQAKESKSSLPTRLKSAFYTSLASSVGSSNFFKSCKELRSATIIPALHRIGDWSQVTDKASYKRSTRASGPR